MKSAYIHKGEGSGWHAQWERATDTYVYSHENGVGVVYVKPEDRWELVYLEGGVDETVVELATEDLETLVRERGLTVPLDSDKHLPVYEALQEHGAHDFQHHFRVEPIDCHYDGNAVGFVIEGEGSITFLELSHSEFVEYLLGDDG